MVYSTVKLRGLFLWGGLWVSFPTKSRPQLYFSPPPPPAKEEHRPTRPPTSSTAMTIKWMKRRYSLSRIWSTVMNSTVCKYYIFGWDHNFFCWTCISSFKCPKFIPSFNSGWNRLLIPSQITTENKWKALIKYNRKVSWEHQLDWETY